MATKFQFRCTDTFVEAMKLAASKMNISVTSWVKMTLTAGLDEAPDPDLPATDTQPSSPTVKTPPPTKTRKPRPATQGVQQPAGATPPAQPTDLGDWAKHPTSLRMFRDQYNRDPKPSEYERWAKTGV